MIKPPFYLGLAAVAAGLWLIPLRAQDDNSMSPQAPAQGDDVAPPVQGAGTPAPDEASDAPDSSASFQTFYDSLGSQGTWVQSSDYGYVWQPQVDDPNWAPYTAGHWVYTDDGWTWVSDESFGWATYHYGRWVNLDGTGWCWVPGYTWAPAWVSWRYGNGYCGWAPLPPDSFVGVDYSGDGFSIGVGFHIGGDCDGFYGIGAGCYNFVPVNCLGYRSYRGYYRNRGDNFAIINHTTNVTNINVTRNGASAASFHRVTAGGPMLEQVNAASSTPVERMRLVRATQPGGGGTVAGNSLALFAPRVGSGASGQPARVAGSIGKASINRGSDVLRPLAVNARLTGATATEAQVQQARIAQDHAPASAKVMSDESMLRPVLQAPLTSMKPVAREAAPARTFNTMPNGFSNAPRPSSPAVITPSVRTYPQTSPKQGVPARVYYPGAVNTSAAPSYQPRPATTMPSGGAESHPYVRPAPPISPYPSAPSAGGNSDGGYPTGGGANRVAPSGGTSNGTHSGPGTQQPSH